MPKRKQSAVPEAVGNTREQLDTKLRGVTRELATLNRELASQMVLLASQTGETAPLISAVEALRQVQAHLAREDRTEANTRDTADVHHALASTLFKLGRAQNDVEALEASVGAYRTAITLASLLGDDDWRIEIRTEYDVALAALRARASDGPSDISALRVA